MTHGQLAIMLNHLNMHAPLQHMGFLLEMSGYEGKPSRKGSVRPKKGRGASWGVVFVLGPCVGDNMTDSPNNHISCPHMV